MFMGQPPGAWTVWFPNWGMGKGCWGKPGGKPFIMVILERLKPRGVPAAILWLFIGKWPLLLASEREGAMWDGSRT